MEKRYERVPTFDWFKENIVKRNKSSAAKVYYYLLSCAKPHIDFETGEIQDLRTHEEDTGKASTLYNNRHKKTRGILNMDSRTYNDAIKTLTEPIVTLDGEPVLDSKGRKLRMLRPIHRTSDVTKSKKMTEFIIGDFYNVPGFFFQQIDKELLSFLATVKNNYIISVLAHLLYMEYVTRRDNVIPTFCAKYILMAFGMEKASNEQKAGIKEAIALLRGWDIVDAEPISLDKDDKPSPLLKLNGINNSLRPKVKEIKEDDILAVLNPKTYKVEKYSKTPDPDNNVRPLEELPDEFKS